MQKKIKNIALSVKYGPHLPTLVAGSIKYLKGNHFDDDIQLNDFSNSYVSDEDSSEKHLLVKGDVILAAKGYRNFAWAYEKKFQDCIPSSLFYVIKVDRNIVMSKYLALCMNAPKFQHKLKLIGLGATIPSIPKNELLRLKVEVPPLEQQAKILAINDLLNQQIELEKQIIEKRKILKKGFIDTLINTNHSI